jgi:1,4-dihydroxy-2-naphthoyl-CoA hydrolase
VYDRTIRFQDTDAAGVVYFANILAICHEAYEASLMASRINVRNFFSQGEVIVPITQTKADFRYPLMCGDQVLVRLIPDRINDAEFKVEYLLTHHDCPQRVISTATTHHVSIQTATRSRIALPEMILQWLAQHSLDAET